MNTRTDSFDTILARTRERSRREKLHREIGALESKLIRVTEQQRFNWRARAWKLTSKIKRLKAALDQPELFF